PTHPTQSVQQLQQMLQPEVSAPSMQILPPPYPALIPGPAGAEGHSAKISSGKQWSEIVRDAIIEGEWQAAGALARPIIFDQQAPRYEQHCWKILQQIKQTVIEHGIKSEAARTMLDWIFTADVNSPHDCRQIARLLLSPSQHVIWEKEWTRLAVMEASRPRDPNDILNGLNPDMLTGSGVYSNLTVQLNYPLSMHHLSAHLARQAFNAIPASQPCTPFPADQQGITKPYTNFIDRLWTALNNPNDLTDEVRQKMFKLLAFENANSKIRPLLITLGKDADVAEMIDMATRASQSQQQVVANAVAEAVKPVTNLLAAVVSKIS
ncbi:GAK8 protein, partial [Toxostoma redivivum]|nr:GAK8 protein [Toxostoma redivivum]